MAMGMQDIMKKAQEMQSEMKRIQDELKAKTVTADAGGGMVTVTVNGAHQIVKISIEKDVISADDKEVLEDLIVAAINKAMEDANTMINNEMQRATSMIPKIPGLNLPF